MEHDLVIRGGHVVDGHGGEPRAADVAVDGATSPPSGGRGRGREEIDADGLLVTPGFVDIHTHYDGQATWDSRITPSCWHGVTTVVMGNCGVGFAPVRPDAHDRLIALMEGVEDIPGAGARRGHRRGTGRASASISTRWSGGPTTSTSARSCRTAALRVYVMGERAARLRRRREDDIGGHGRLATEAMRAGAIGFSTRAR